MDVHPPKYSKIGFDTSPHLKYLKSPEMPKLELKIVLKPSTIFSMIKQCSHAEFHHQKAWFHPRLTGGISERWTPWTPGLPPGSPTDALRHGNEALHPSLGRPGDRSYYWMLLLHPPLLVQYLLVHPPMLVAIFSMFEEYVHVWCMNLHSTQPACGPNSTWSNIPEY